MPLRLLLYISEVYQNIIDHKALFNNKLVNIPTPQFIVLYNGIKQYDDRKELRLSDAFKDIEGLKLPDNNGNSLELVAQVYNINYGRNCEILKKCVTLDGYSLFIEKIREYNKEFPIDESVTLAVDYCIENDILKPFMEKHRLEVVKMLLEDITVEDEIEAAREEGMEDGIEIGVEKGIGIGSERSRLEIARKMKIAGKPLNEIADFTGLPTEEIKKL
jgi:predicted transposase/invertase (TIGR01784 family)